MKVGRQRQKGRMVDRDREGEDGQRQRRRRIDRERRKVGRKRQRW